MINIKSIIFLTPCHLYYVLGRTGWQLVNIKGLFCLFSYLFSLSYFLLPIFSCTYFNWIKLTISVWYITCIFQVDQFGINKCWYHNTLIHFLSFNLMLVPLVAYYLVFYNGDNHSISERRGLTAFWYSTTRSFLFQIWYSFTRLFPLQIWYNFTR